LNPSVRHKCLLCLRQLEVERQVHDAWTICYPILSTLRFKLKSLGETLQSAYKLHLRAWMARMGTLTNFEICWLLFFFEASVPISDELHVKCGWRFLAHRAIWSLGSGLLIPVARTKEFVEAGESGWSFVCSSDNGSGLDVRNNFHKMYSWVLKYERTDWINKVVEEVALTIWFLVLTPWVSAALLFCFLQWIPHLCFSFVFKTILQLGPPTFVLVLECYSEWNWERYSFATSGMVMVRFCD
jgi:hypothetical protein